MSVDTVDEDPDPNAWREETFAAIFDGPSSLETRPTTKRPLPGDYGDFLLAWADQQRAAQREDRSRRRRRDIERRSSQRPGVDENEHVFARTSRRAQSPSFADRELEAPANTCSSKGND